MAYDRLFPFLQTFGSITYDFDAALVTEINPDTDSGDGVTWVTRNGGTFRITRTDTDSVRERTLSDERLSGFWYQHHNLDPGVLEIDVGVSGTFRVRLAFSDSASTSIYPQRVVVRDGKGGTALHTASGDINNPDKVLAIDGTTYATLADYLNLTNAQEPYVDVTITGTILALDVGVNDGTTNTTKWNYVRITEMPSADLVVQEASHSHTADSPTLAVKLVVDEASHSHTAENLNLGESRLSVQGAEHSHGTDAVTLTHAYVLAADETEHPHYILIGDLVAKYDLAVAEASHAHSGDIVGLSGSTHPGTAHDAAHAHTVDPIVLGSNYALTVASANHAHTVPVVGAVQDIALTIASASHPMRDRFGLLLSGAVLVPVERALFVTASRRAAVVERGRQGLTVNRPPKAALIKQSDKIMFG